MLTAIVPARSGSKRLPHKNIKVLGGRPLLLWTLEACCDTAHIDEVILSTDSLEYWQIAQECIDSEKLSLDLRSKEDAGDKIKIFDYIKNNRQKIFGTRRGAFLLALPTVPFRTKKNISDAIALYEGTGRAVFSATNYGFPISFAFEFNAVGAWTPIFGDSPMLTGNTRSQNQVEAFHPNGAIYLRNITDLANRDLRTLYDDAIPYLMSRNESIDIDCEADFQLAEALLKVMLESARSSSDP